MNIFARAEQYLPLVPIVSQGVKSFEDALPDSTGKVKFDAMWQFLQQVVGVAAEMLPLVQQLATFWVKFHGLNKTELAQAAATPTA